jgi:hypothetical protein
MEIFGEKFVVFIYFLSYQKINTSGWFLIITKKKRNNEKLAVVTLHFFEEIEERTGTSINNDLHYFSMMVIISS